MRLASLSKRWTLAHYGAVVATFAFVLSILNYNLSARKELREIDEKEPIADVQIVPSGVSTGVATISLINRSDFNLKPQDVTVLPSLEAGEFYLANARQSIDALKSSLSLTSMGVIASKATGTMKVTIAGVTDGKYDSFERPINLQFVVRFRIGDARDTLKTSEILRSVHR